MIKTEKSSQVLEIANLKIKLEIIEDDNEIYKEQFKDNLEIVEKITEQSKTITNNTLILPVGDTSKDMIEKKYAIKLESITSFGNSTSRRQVRSINLMPKLWW